MDSFFNKISFILILLFIVLNSIPSTNCLSTVAISENSNFTIVCALIPGSNNQQSVINCSSFPLQTQFRVNSSLSFSGLVSGDGFLCGLTTLYSNSVSTMVCWRFSGGVNNVVYKRIYQGPVINDLEAGNSHVCGLVNGADQLECWQWPEFVPNPGSSYSSIAVGGDFVCGISRIGGIACEGNNGGSVVRDVPNGNFSVIGAGFRHACAIGAGDELVCWGESGQWPQGRFADMALGENRSCGLQTNGSVVCWGLSDFSLPVSLQETEFLSIEAKRNVFCGVNRTNFALYCWGNENFDSDMAVFGEVLPGSCRRNEVCRCGSIAGSGRFCQEGYSICELCQSNGAVPPVAMPPSSPPLPQPGRSEWSGRMTAFLVVGCVGSSAFLLVVGFFLVRYCMFKRCRVHDSGRIDDEPGALEQGVSQRENSRARQAPGILDKRLSQLASMGNAGQLEEYSLQVLLEATNNFSEAQKIGTGSFGSVYHGLLEDGREVAIKRAELTSTSSYAIGTKRQEDKDSAFINELESLSRLHHKNLVRLLGFCEDSNERVLVYEFMHNGTLHDHLHKLENSPLTSWPGRIKVALDAARGIEYLHKYAVPPIIHRDIKSSNILLDESWTAKVSDFGLSLMGPQEDESHLSLRAAGTVGYMDPEYYRLQKLTTKSDVYSFGVILLELLSGFKAIHKNENGVPRNVVDFVVPYVVQDDIHRVLDKRVPPPTPYEIEAVSYVGYLAADCVMLESKDRPSMSEIVDSLERALAACLVHPTSLSRSTTGSST